MTEGVKRDGQLKGRREPRCLVVGVWEKKENQGKRRNGNK